MQYGGKKIFDSVHGFIHLDHLETEFNVFLEENSQELKTEFFLPSVVDSLIQNHQYYRILWF
ncbi:hypothetical protein COB11_05010 [Candidatus Aerophobetes bacterium]|uniref:Uncharacterized protein n=1 Tax=Aerophobetes bacterium TaxID=2030807 RepID=A0A2A4YG34_UNCAE|nr:MAG: hypothetical protein COB11_05010 [Candidatus Aerophobetes bacterium]